MNVLLLFGMKLTFLMASCMVLCVGFVIVPVAGTDTLTPCTKGPGTSTW